MIAKTEEYLNEVTAVNVITDLKRLQYIQTKISQLIMIVRIIYLLCVKHQCSQCQVR
jgi:hypothetical protein